MQQASEWPERRAHPVLVQISDELSIIGEQVALHPNRFAHWLGQLLRQYPQRHNEQLYAQLVGMALDLAPLRCLAALQLFTLGTLHLSASQAAQITDDAYLGKGTKKLRQKARDLDGAAGMQAPTVAGARLRHSKRKH